MHVVVLGAGVIGVSSAWFLRQAGHQVTVVERQAGPALETSFANGGQLSTGHVEPWASPETFPQLLKWGFKEEAPLLFRPRLDPQQWCWGMGFLRECWPGRSAHNLAQLLQLGLYSRSAHQVLQQPTSISYHHLQRGILHLYATGQGWQRGCRAAAVVARLGYVRQPWSKAQALEHEPALSASQGLWAGATFTPGDASGDAHLWTVALAQQCQAAGVKFLYQHQVTDLLRQGDQVTGVLLRSAPSAEMDPAAGPDVPGTAPGAAPLAQERLGADAVVVALGSYSTALLAPLGIRIPVYPVKGYSATLEVLAPSLAPTCSITDDAHKIVLTRLGQQLRVAGTAEFNGFDTQLNERRCQALVARTQALFPGACDYARPRFWTGLRPATPSNCPLIGATRLKGLYLNTGHGTLGWTLGTGSGKALAEIVSGRSPQVDFEFLGE